MKILYANKFFFLNGGSETVMFQEREFVHKQGAEIIDFSMQDERNLASDYSEYFISPVSYRRGSILKRLRAAGSFIHSNEAVKNIAKLAKKTKPDIAHLHNIYHQLTPSIIPVLKQLGVKVVLTLHDGKLLCPAYLMLSNGKPCQACQGRKFYFPLIRNCQNSRLQGLLLSMEAYYHQWKKSYDLVDVMITPSQFLADTVSVRTGLDKVTVLHNGIDMYKYLPTWEDENYILYLGRLSSEKGVANLIKAHAQMSTQKTKLVIVGTGPLEQELRKNATDNVIFTGYCSGETLLDYIRKASCLVIPSECYENCSMTVIEAMAMGKPVIGSRIGGIPEQVQDGINGFLCEAGNIPEFAMAMDKMMSNPSMRKEMGLACRAKAESDYNLTTHNAKLMTIYKRLLTSAN